MTHKQTDWPICPNLPHGINYLLKIMLQLNKLSIKFNQNIFLPVPLMQQFNEKNSKYPITILMWKKVKLMSNTESAQASMKKSAKLFNSYLAYYFPYSKQLINNRKNVLEI